MQFFEGDRDGNLMSIQLVCVISSVRKEGKFFNPCAIFKGSQYQGGY